MIEKDFLETLVKEQVEIKELLHEINARLKQILLKVVPKSQDERIEYITNLVKEKGKLYVDEIEEITGLSRPWTLRIMKRVADSNKNILFFSGAKPDPSFLIISDGNEVETIAIEVIKDLMIRGIHSTKTLASVKNQYKLSDNILRKIVGKIVNLTNGRIFLTGDPSIPLINRRLKYGRRIR